MLTPPCKVISQHLNKFSELRGGEVPPLGSVLDAVVHKDVWRVKTSIVPRRTVVVNSAEQVQMHKSL